MSVSDPEITPRRTFSTKAMAALVIVAAFIGGVLAGVVGDRAWLMKRGKFHPERAMRFLTPHAVERLDRALDLTDAQRKQVAEILERRHARIDDVWKRVHPQLRVEIEQTNAEIEKILTPEQREKFARMKMHLRRRGGGPPHPPGRGRRESTRSGHS